MPFALHGHDAVLHALRSGLSDGRLHHAYLFTGPAHVGKTTLAVQLAQAVNCDSDDPPCGTCLSCLRIAAGEHADVRTLGINADAEEGPRTVIGIDAVRDDLIASAHLLPYEGRARVYMVQGADRLSTDAANALLKILEEPPPSVLILLLSDDPDGVLPTVRSRCQTLDMRPLPRTEVAAILQSEHGVSEQQADVVARLARGCLGWAIAATNDQSLLAGVHQQLERIVEVVEGPLEGRLSYAEELARRYQRDRAVGREQLFLWSRWLRDVLLIQQGRDDDVMHAAWRDTLHAHAATFSPRQVASWLRRLEETLEMLERNANPRLTLELLMLEAPSAA